MDLLNNNTSDRDTENSTTIDNSTDIKLLLTQLNDKMVIKMVPVFVYVSFLLIVGLCGNILVLYYYGWKSKQTTNSVFICVLAVYDLTTCCVSIPIDMVDLRYFYMFSNLAACKILKYFNHVTATGSVITLIAIASDRFRRICRPLKSQLGLKRARQVGYISLLFALVSSTPSLSIYTSVKSELISENGIVLNGHDCSARKDKSHKLLYFIFHVVLLSLFLVAATALSAIYAMVVKKLYKWRQTQKRPMIDEVPLSTVEHFRDNGAHKGLNDTNEPGSDGEVTTDRNVKMSDSMTTHKKTLCSSSDPNNPSTTKFTLMMLTITIFFILSFLPFLVLQIWQLLTIDFNFFYSTVGFQLGARSFFLNAAVNPIIYGFFNSRFRGFAVNFLCYVCKTKNSTKEPVSASST